MVPEKTDRKVQVILRKIGSQHEPIYVPVYPERYAQVNECTTAVEKKVKIDGGEIVYGWQIWQTPLICEAEFHAVWRSPQGELIDITPKQSIVDNILFVPDDKIQYNGCQIENIRINNTSSILVDDLIALYKALFRIMNKGERAGSYEIQLEGQEATIYSNLQSLKIELQHYIYNGGTLETYCFCGSGRRYNECHRVELSDALSRV
jgi:hypothetical protein